MINAQTRIALAFTAGVCVGGGIGYLIADHHIKKLAAADLEAVQDMFHRIRAEDAEKSESIDEVYASEAEENRYQTPAEGIAAQEEIIRLGYAAEEDIKRTIKLNSNYVGPDANPYDPNDDPDVEELEIETDPDLVEEVDYVNRISRNPMHENDPDDVTSWDRSPEYPYVITEAEYRIDMQNFEKNSITYYAGDHVLAEEDGSYIPDRNGTVGDSNLEFFGLASGDENILHVRNERVMCDFEVTLDQGKYAHVIGFDISDADDAPKRKIKKMRDRG